jgi:hypothetical protein
MDEATATVVVALVSDLVAQAASTPTPTRRRPRLPKPPARARLALDAAALLAGLRPGVLLDYGGPTFQDQASLAAVAVGLSNLMSGGRCVRLARLGGGEAPTDDDDNALHAGPALFLVCLPMDEPLVAPWPVSLSPAAGAVWSADGRALARGLSSTAAALHRDANGASPPAVLDICVGDTPHEAVAAWLLGYPAALVRGCTSASGGGGVAPAAAALSSATLVALRACPPPTLAASLAAAGWPAPPGVMMMRDGEGGRVDVCSFALPPGGPPGEWLRAWTDGVRQRADGSGWDSVGLATGSMGLGGLAV